MGSGLVFFFFFILRLGYLISLILKGKKQDLTTYSRNIQATPITSCNYLSYNGTPVILFL